MAEAGLPGFEVTAWYGVVAPLGVPKAAAATARQDDLERSLEGPTFRDKLTGMGATPVGGTPEEFGAMLTKRERQVGEGHQGRQHPSRIGGRWA